MGIAQFMAMTMRKMITKHDKPLDRGGVLTFEWLGIFLVNVSMECFRGNLQDTHHFYICLPPKNRDLPMDVYGFPVDFPEKTIE